MQLLFKVGDFNTLVMVPNVCLLQHWSRSTHFSFRIRTSSNASLVLSFLIIRSSLWHAWTTRTRWGTTITLFCEPWSMPLISFGGPKYRQCISSIWFLDIRVLEIEDFSMFLFFKTFLVRFGSKFIYFLFSLLFGDPKWEDFVCRVYGVHNDWKGIRLG